MNIKIKINMNSDREDIRNKPWKITGIMKRIERNMNIKINMNMDGDKD